MAENNTDKRPSTGQSNSGGQRGSGGHQNRQGGDRRNQQRNKKQFFFKRKVCQICVKKAENEIDYKNVSFLRRFVTEKGKIVPRRLSGTCAKHQRQLTRAIKQSRTIALLPYTQL